MTEPALKRRVLTKVRRQYLHKTPPEEDDPEQHANLPATPDQLNQNAVRFLEPSLGLVESNRTISAGAQYINSCYKVNAIQVNRQFPASVVTIDLETNGTNILPWEYCAKRLESYGDLELATWAKRLKSYHENYPRLMSEYFEYYNNAGECAAIIRGKAQAVLDCQELERKYAYSKLAVYLRRDSMMPVSFTYGENMLKEIGHSVESFVDWIKENGIPKLFGGDSQFHLERSKEYLNKYNFKPPFFHAGHEYNVQLLNREKRKKEVRVKMFYAVEPKPEGFFMHIYIVKYDEDKTVGDGNDRTDESNSDDKEGEECKRVRQEGSERVEDPDNV